ncbi:MAG TPA: hypothetical protein ENJ87_12405 [Gammaproteobacteria bacterium]|nr:hypothetical protein [Gammaproteobacteria bacterium]
MNQSGDNNGDNMAQQHIDSDTLNLYIKTSMYSASCMDDQVYHRVLDHLATCEECRGQASVISLIHDQGHDIRQSSELTEEQHRLIGDYLDGYLTAEEEIEARALIGEQPAAMHTALHYQSHSDEMRAHVTADNDTQNETSVATEPLETSSEQKPLTWIRQLFDFQTPMLYTMATTAVFFIAVMILTQFPGMADHRTVIARYQDDATLRFTDESKLPGIGFFTQSTDTAIPFEDIDIELVSEDSIKISWPEIEGAELYKIRIQVFNQGNKALLNEQTTQASHATFNLASAHDDSGNKRYEWVLYGNTADERMFYASGGFVIATVEKEDTSW